MITINIHKKLRGGQGDFNLHVCEEIQQHQFIGLYGNSGSGKTTFLRILSGLEKPDSGTIVVNEKVWFDSVSNINLLPQKRELGYVFQENVLFPNMDVLENLVFALKKGQSKDLLNELVAIMELEAFLNVPIQQLSGGQKQRIALAQTLVQKPKLLLLDEPLSALDYEMRQKLQDFISKAHHSYGLTSIMVSHDPRELHKTVSEIWKIDSGMIIQKGSAEVVLPLSNY